MKAPIDTTRFGVPVWGRDRATALKAEDIVEVCEANNNNDNAVLSSSSDTEDEVFVVPGIQNPPAVPSTSQTKKNKKNSPPTESSHKKKKSLTLEQIIDAKLDDANKSESVSEDTMQELMNVLINIGISHFDIGKVVEFCYNDPIKVWYGYIKNHKKTVKNGQARTRESEEYKRSQRFKAEARKVKPQSNPKFDKDLLAYCVENGIFKDFQDTFESSDDNTNVINALREPIVVNQEPGKKSSQGPPLINQNCCYECGNSLDGIFCRQCICKTCGKCAHFGYNCPPKDPINSKPEPCNQTINEIPQTLPSIDPSCFSLPRVSKPNLVDDPPNVFNLPPETLPIVHPTCNYENENSFIYNSKPHSFNVSPSVLTYPPQPQFETYSCELCGNDSHYGYDCPSRVPLMFFLLRSTQFSRSSPVNLLILLQFHREFIEADFDPNDDTSSDDDSFENIEYIDASPSFSELDSLEEENEEQEEKEFDLEDILQIQDVILREKVETVRKTATKFLAPLPGTSVNIPSSKSRYAIKECSTCGSLYTKECCSIGSFEDKILTPVSDSSPRCARCGTPVDGLSCRGCAFLQKKFDEDLHAYCVENGIFKDFQDTFESSDDNTNVVNALQEPCVVNQNSGVKFSQDPPQIDHNCCYECGDSLDGIFLSKMHL
ncbi:hypothetical protein Tco_0001071 [Tanacetum coccineum]